MKYIKLLVFLCPAFIFSQQIQKVDFKTLHASIQLNPQEKQVSGTVNYTFELLSKIDTIAIDAKSMNFTSVTINGKNVKFKNSETQLKLFEGYKKGKNTLAFNYTATPKQTLYFVGEGDGLQIWTQGQGKYTSHWLPSFDDMNEKVIFNLEITYNKDFEVLSNGVLKQKKDSGNSVKWQYQMQKPMSSYLVMLAVGKFEKQIQTTTSGTVLEMYYRPEDSNKFEPTYRYSKQIFDFFEKEIGVKYPWQVYRQVPVKDFLYAGMENTSATIFAQDFVVDSTGFNDRNYINVNAHELAHQWFGDLITATSGKHHWLQEGFATYYALLAEKELFGENHFNHELYEIAERLQQISKTDTIPILNEKASSLTFYQKGAWALHVLREGVGEEPFRKAVKNYLEKYAFKNVDTNNFLAEINKLSPYNTNDFRKRWLEKGGFEIKEAVDLLNKNKFMQQYFQLGEWQNKTFYENKEKYEQILKSDVLSALKEEVIYQISDIPFEEKSDLLKLAMQSNNLKLRQAVARTTTKIPAEFLEEYKSFLKDDSYITREIALNMLCSRFPERQSEFLDLSKNWIGFNDKNLRILWLALAYTAPGYEVSNKETFYKELLDYSSSKHESGIRQNALANLLYIDKKDPEVYKNLVNATLHHKWQFVKFGRDNIRRLLKDKSYRPSFESLLLQLSEIEKKRLQQYLEE